MKITPRGSAGAVVAVVVAFAAALAVAPVAAGAGKPQIVEPAPVTLAFPQDWGCTEDVFTEFTLERRITLFFEDGEVVKEARHVRWSGTLSSMDGTRSIPWGAIVTFTFDYVARTLTKTGRFRYSKPGGSGLVIQDTGRTVEDLGTGEVTMDTAGTIAAYEQGICDLLYGS